MEISADSLRIIGIILITVPTIEFGGYFLLSNLGRRDGAIRSDLQASYFRAGHAHAGVLVILAIIAQLLVDTTNLTGFGAWLLRAGFFSAPILVSAGFFGGAPAEGTRPRRLIWLVYIGAILLAISAVILGIAMLAA